MRRKQLFFYVMVTLCLMVFSACGQKRPIVKSTPVFPPDNLMQECPEASPPAGKRVTYGELLKYTLEQKNALDRCNADKAALRQWKAEVQASTGSE